MKISHVSPLLSRGVPASARTSGPPGTAGDPVSGHHVSEPEIVQLTRNHDGIWRVPVAAESNTSFNRASHRSIFPPPRLASSVGQQYAPTGRLQASMSTPGLLLDIYV